MKSITVIKFKVAEAEPGQLEAVAKDCRLARNVAAEDWLLRSRGMPECDRQARAKGRSESNLLYHAIMQKASVSSQEAAMIGGEVKSYLNAKVDWRRGMKGSDGKRAKRRDAILNYEDRSPFFTALEIPVHNNPSLCNVSRDQGGGFMLTVRRPNCAVESLTLKISLRKMPPRFVRILNRIASGEKPACSKLVTRGGEWFWFYPAGFEQPRANPDVSVTLTPIIPKIDGDPERPFRIHAESRSRNLGDGRYLKHETVRREAIIKAVGWRYRQGMGAGHGRKKIDQAVSLRRTALRNMVSEVRRRLIRDVVRFARSQEAGVVIYRKPTGPVKTMCWFEHSGLTWDWTRFEGDLKNSLAKYGIALDVKALKIQEVNEKRKETE